MTLIISHGTKDDHMNKLKRILDKLDAENMAISLEKNEFGYKKVEWLDYVINEYGTIPMRKKNRNNRTTKSPENFKQLKSFMGPIHHLNKFIPNLAQLCKPFRPLLSVENKFHFTWEEPHEKEF